MIFLQAESNGRGRPEELTMPKSYTPNIVEKGSREEYPTVKEYMTRNLISFSPEMDVYEAVDVLIKNRVSGAPVVDKEDRVLGMLSEKECLKLLNESVYHTMPIGSVADYMTTTFETISSDDDIFKAAASLHEKTRRRLPVVDDGRLVGQISRRDLLFAIQKMKKVEGKSFSR